MVEARIDLETDGDEQKAIVRGVWENLPKRLPNLRGRELIINYALGWRGENLEFLRHPAFLECERVHILDPNLKHVDGLYHLVALKKLILDDAARTVIDIDRFPDLSELAIGTWSRQRLDRVLASEKIQTFAVSGFPGPDLLVFERMRSLRNFTLYNTRIQSLNGCRNFAELEKLGLLRAPKLQTLEGLAECQLRSVWIERAKGLESLKGIEVATELETLVLNDCTRLQSLRPLKNLNNLIGIHLGWETNVKDGDFGVLEGMRRLKHVSFVNRRHYSRQSQDFPKLERLPI
jgi:hypothetical protein